MTAGKDTCHQNLESSIPMVGRKTRLYMCVLWCTSIYAQRLWGRNILGHCFLSLVPFPWLSVPVQVCTSCSELTGVLQIWIRREADIVAIFPVK